MTRRSTFPPQQVPTEELPSPIARRNGLRTQLAVPLMRQGAALGAMLLSRREVRPFSDRQVRVIETFADQAVIAIENSRLFAELNDSNASLTETLDQQTATAEVLKVISQSPTDLGSALGAICASAARLCGAADARILRYDGRVLRFAAHHGTVPGQTIGVVQEPHPGLLTYRAVLQHRTIHVHDLREAAAADPEILNGQPANVASGVRTVLLTPLMRDAAPLGVVYIRRMEVRPLTPSQITLLESFASQAVITIENARLFSELNESNAGLRDSLEQQTATAEVLKAVSREPANLEQVLSTIAEAVGRLCGGTSSRVWRVAPEGLHRAAVWNAAHRGGVPIPPLGEARPLDRGSLAGRAVLDRRTVYGDRQK